MATITTAASGLASATATWSGGVVPVEGDKVIIAKTATGADLFTTDTAGYAISATNITLTGSVASGSYVVNEAVRFGTDPVYYNVTAWNSSTKVLTISPGLATAIPAAATTVMACGHVVEIDGTYTWGDDSVTTTIPNAAINVSGTFKASRTTNSSLTCKGLILVNTGGMMDYGSDGTYGTPTDPIPSSVTATLLLHKRTTPSAGSGLRQVIASANTSHTYRWLFCGDSTKTRKGVLASTASASATSCTLSAAPTNWAANDEIMFVPTTDNSTNVELEVVTITSVSGTTVNFSPALTYAHLAGSWVGNKTANVTIKSYSEVSGQTGGARIELPNISSSYPSMFAIFNGARLKNLSDGSASLYMTMRPSNPIDKQGLRFVNSVMDCTVVSVSALFQSFDNSLIENSIIQGGGLATGSISANVDGLLLALTGTMYSSAVYHNGSFKNSWVALYGSAAYGPGIAGCTYENVTVSGYGTAASYSVSSFGVKHIGCDIGSTYGFRGSFSDKLFRMTANFIGGGPEFTSCLFGTNTTALANGDAFLKTAADNLIITRLYKNNSATSHDITTNAGTVACETTLKNRSTSSVSLQPWVVGRTLTRKFYVGCPNGATIRIVGYCRFDTNYYNSNNYTAPTVTIGGLGTDTASYTATSAANGAWEKFDLEFTNDAGYDGNVTVTYSAFAKAVTNGTVYFDGVPDSPFVTKARHYGFIYDESNPSRVVNATVSATEANALLLGDTEITVTAATSAIALNADRTFQQVYDYTQAWACTTANLGYAVPLTGVGIAGSPSLFAVGNFTTTGYTLNGGGSLSMGSNILTATGYTYTGGTFSQATTVPSFAGGTLSIGSAGTYTFTQAAAMILSMTPTAPGTYSLGSNSFTGQVDLRNTSGTHAITVELPTGTSYTTANNTGAAITVSTPQLYQSVTVSGCVAGSRIQIYDTTSSTELYNGTPSFPYTWTDSVAAAADRAIRLRVAYVSGATAKEFIEANIGTCGQTSGTAAVSYLVNQTNDPTYNTNAIDGPAIYATSGITFTDAATDLVNCNIAGGSVTWPTIYACFVYWLSTSTGIADDITYISAPDPANYLLTAMKIKNTNANPLTITGGFGRSATSGLVADIIDTAGSTGNIFPAPDHVVAYATGSALTAGQDAKLTAIDAVCTSFVFTSGAVQADIQRVNGYEVTGDGQTGTEWGPV